MAQLIDILAVGVTGDDGEPLAAGTAKFYLSGTTTLQTVFQENDLENAHTNPATLDAAGRLIAYTNKSLKIIISDSDGTVVRTIENVQYHRGNIISSELSSDSVTPDAIASSVAGDGLGQASDGALNVRVDDSTIEIATDILRVKAGGIDTAQMANDAVDATILDDTDDYVVGSLKIKDGANESTLTCSANGQINFSGNSIAFSAAARLDARGSNFNQYLPIGTRQGSLVLDGNSGADEAVRIQHGTSGSVASGGGTLQVNYTVSFLLPTNVILLNPTASLASAAYNISAQNESSFTITNNTASNLSFFWIAIGRFV